ncbi:hypothetical protein ACOME3_006045 [Neoechinorhynchus agilis]
MKPDHGETYAMRGLILMNIGGGGGGGGGGNQPERQMEAKESILKGLRNNMSSSICWQVFGHFNRTYGHYEDAAKAYVNAYNRDKENFTILRDLSNVQVHLRDFESFKRTRHNMLMLRPNQRASWIGYALACHLCGEHFEALEILRLFQGIKLDPKLTAVEDSELVLYENMIIRESMPKVDALEHLKENEHRIRNECEFLRIKLDLTDGEDSECISRLVSRYPDMACGLLPSNLYKSILNVAQDDKASLSLKVFMIRHDPDSDSRKNRIRHFIRSYLERGSPAIGEIITDCGSVVREQAAEIVRELLSEVQDPAVHARTRLLHAQLMDNFEEALKELNEVISHTPTFIESLEAKADVLQSIGAYRAALDVLMTAQSLDTADRYLNTKCVQLLLKCGMRSEADELIRPFCRETGTIEDYMRHLHCLWYLEQCATMYSQLQEYGRALFYCHDLRLMHDRFFDNQYDFHSYCLLQIQSIWVNFIEKSH